MTEKKYRVAIVGGAGTWGRFYTQAYAAHAECEIVALVDRAADRREALAAHYNVQATYDTVEDLLSRDIPDIVSAILPVAYTHDTVIACAEAGVKVVSCEKPIDYQLCRADETVRICQEKGTALGCGTALRMQPYDIQVAAWVRAGNIGKLTAAAIPNGLPVEVSGGGCHSLAELLLLTGMEVEWVEGWTLPPEPGYANPEATQDSEVDCPAYGRLGLSGGLVCELLKPDPDHSIRCSLSVRGDNGQVWLAPPKPVLIQGTNAQAAPAYPDLFSQPSDETWPLRTIERLVRAVETGPEIESSGHTYRQVLEIAIALKLSAQDNHRRIELPLADRSLKIYPHPYRLHGGDKAGWESIGYTGPPEMLSD
jgi:predicted dehydrogenase